jgi:hypothetical protein
MSELRWHYGPTDWDPEPGHMWHYDCPAGRGEVMIDGDGWAYCEGCEATQAPDDGPSSARPDEEPT